MPYHLLRHMQTRTSADGTSHLCLMCNAFLAQSLPNSFHGACHIVMGAATTLARLPIDVVRWAQRLLLASAAMLLVWGVLLAFRFAAAARRSGLSSSRLKPQSASCTQQYGDHQGAGGGKGVVVSTM